MGSQFRSCRASYVLKLLKRVGYSEVAHAGKNRGKGSNKRLVAERRPPITWGYTNRSVLSGAQVRQVLIGQAGLTLEEAIAALSPEQLGGHYIARTPPDFLDTLELVPGRVPKRWTSHGGKRLYEYDRMHGHVECYDRRGKHIAVLSVDTGETIGEAKRGRSIDV